MNNLNIPFKCQRLSNCIKENKTQIDAAYKKPSLYVNKNIV